MKNISIIGLGYIGLPLACVLSNIKKNNKLLFQVNAYDKKYNGKNKENFFDIKKKIIDKKLLDRIKNAKKKNLINFSNDYSRLKNSNVVVVSVNFHFETSQYKNQFKKIKSLFAKISQNINPNTLIFMETTLPPGTCDNIIIPEIKRVFKKRKINVKNLLFAYSYERVMPGKNYYDSIVNINRCYSANNKTAFKKCYEFLKQFLNVKKYKPYKFSKIIDCEASKILENSYRAINIAMIDEWTNYSIKSKINLNNIIDAIKIRKTHNNLMSPGLGVGGYCLTKDQILLRCRVNIFLMMTIIFL